MLGEDSGEICDESVFAECGENGDHRQNPERSRAQCGRDADSLGRTFKVNRRELRPIAHQQRSERKAEERYGAQHEVSAAPAMPLNHPLGKRRNDDGTTSFISIDPTISGFNFVVGERDGKRVLIIRDAQHEYAFVEPRSP